MSRLLAPALLTQSPPGNSSCSGFNAPVQALDNGNKSSLVLFLGQVGLAMALETSKVTVALKRRSPRPAPARTLPANLGMALDGAF